MNDKEYLPLTLDLTGQRILVIGGGADAAKKVKILQRFTNRIDVLANGISPEMLDTRVNLLSGDYQTQMILDYILVYVSTDDKRLEERVVEDGKVLRVLVNVHDKPEKCRFISPAIFQYEDYTVAVGSNGKNVYESIKIRNEVGNYLVNNYFQN